jgi:hypothetical protein
MTHEGGDSLEIKDLQIIVRPSDEFGRGQSEYGQLLLNASTVTDGTVTEHRDRHGNLISVTTDYWINADDGTYGVMSWLPGQSMYVIGEDLKWSGLISPFDYPPCYYNGLQGGRTGEEYCFITSLNNQFNIGKKVSLEVYDKDGKLISTSDMTIQA